MNRVRGSGLFLLLLCTVVALFAHLGALPLQGAEGRWAVIARSMYRSHDLLRPMDGPNPYWDKPLVSYWQILPVSWVAGGVSEATARVPSALWALVVLLLTYDLARRWFDAETALVAAGVLATTWGFQDWGRNALVEMANTGVILLAIWYFLIHRHDPGKRWFYVFAVILGLGANMKGLTAYAVPGFAILLLSVLRKDWRWFPPWPTLILGALLSLAVFLIVPAAGCWHGQNWEPLRLVWRENVVRFFEPFDHKSPFYIYFYRIFDLSAPWSLLLPAALVYCVRQGRLRESHLGEALILAGAVFLFFTLSGSRRSYYLLPILPFVALVLGDFLVRSSRGAVAPWATKYVAGTGLVLAGVMILAAVALPVLILMGLKALPPQADRLLLPAIFLALAGVGVAAGALKRNAYWLIGGVLAVFCLYSVALAPWIGTLPEVREKRESARQLRELNVPVAFVGTDSTQITFYLDREYEILESRDAAEAWAARTRGAVVVFRKYPPAPWVCVVEGHKWKAFRLGPAAGAGG